MRQTFVLLLLSYCLFTSCKEEKDELPPVINIQLPIENLRANVLDEIEVRASISDNEIIKSVVLSLVSAESQNAVLSAVRFEPNSSSFELRDFFVLSDSLLEGGEYYFRVEASDEDNTISGFRSIFINAFPRRKLSTIVSTSANNLTQVYEDESDLNFDLIHTFSAPHLATELNNYNQQYWFFPALGNTLEVLDLRKKTIDFNQSFISNFNQTFSSTDYKDRDVFIALKTGELQAYNSNFQDNYTYLSPQQKAFEKVRIGENNVLLEEAFNSGNNRRLLVLFRSSGILRNSISLNEPIKDLHFLNDEEALLFQNDKDGGFLQNFSIPNLSLRRIRSLRDSIVDVLQISPSLYLIATQSNIQQYNSSTDNLVDYLNLANAKLAFDEAKNQLYIANGQQLSVYPFGSTNQISTYSFQNDIQSIHFRYNY